MMDSRPGTAAGMRSTFADGFFKGDEDHSRVTEKMVRSSLFVDF